MLVVAGKGTSRNQIIAGVTHPFDDVAKPPGLELARG